jgi:hypothetical protein
MVEYKQQWRSLTPLAHYEWVSETHSFPTAVELRAEGQKGAPNVHARFELRDGVPEVVEFRMSAKDKGRAVRTADLAAWNLEGLALNGFRQFARPHDEPHRLGSGPRDEREFWELEGQLVEDRGRRRGPSADELEAVARVYREAIDGRPTEAVQVRLNYSRRTAARRVQQARAAGLLPATTPGKKRAD